MDNVHINFSLTTEPDTGSIIYAQVTIYINFQKVYLAATLHICVKDRRPQCRYLSVHALLLLKREVGVVKSNEWSTAESLCNGEKQLVEAGR